MQPTNTDHHQPANLKLLTLVGACEVAASSHELRGNTEDQFISSVASALKKRCGRLADSPSHEWDDIARSGLKFYRCMYVDRENSHRIDFETAVIASDSDHHRLFLTWLDNGGGKTSGDLLGRLRDFVHELIKKDVKNNGADLRDPSSEADPADEDEDAAPRPSNDDDEMFELELSIDFKDDEETEDDLMDDDEDAEDDLMDDDEE